METEHNGPINLSNNRLLSSGLAIALAICRQRREGKAQTYRIYLPSAFSGIAPA